MIRYYCGGLLPDVGNNFKEFEIIRNKSIHFCPETDTNDRGLALEAIHLLQKIVQKQFGAFGTPPWYIRNISGAAYIKTDYESVPFINKVYLPNCALVGPKHRLELVRGKWIVHDDFEYEDIRISDEELAK